MFNENIKIHVLTPEVSELVQEKLFEMGYRWRSGDKKLLYVNEPYLFCEGGYIVRSSKKPRFNDHLSKQVHYLQVLAGDLNGTLFVNTKGHLTYYESNNVIYWVYNGVLHNLQGFSAEYFLQHDDNVKVDVNEEEIMTNEMPKLEAGKHVVELEDGRVAFFVGADTLLYITDAQSAVRGYFSGWDNASVQSDLITKICERKNAQESLCLDVENTELLQVIWKRDDESDKRRREYEQLQQQITELQKQADKLGESL